MKRLTILLSLLTSVSFAQEKRYMNNIEHQFELKHETKKKKEFYQIDTLLVDTIKIDKIEYFKLKDEDIYLIYIKKKKQKKNNNNKQLTCNKNNKILKSKLKLLLINKMIPEHNINS